MNSTGQRTMTAANADHPKSERSHTMSSFCIVRLHVISHKLNVTKRRAMHSQFSKDFLELNKTLPTLEQICIIIVEIQHTMPVQCSTLENFSDRVATNELMLLSHQNSTINNFVTRILAIHVSVLLLQQKSFLLF